jgi:hypothetical protein
VPFIFFYLYVNFDIRFMIIWYFVNDFIIYLSILPESPRWLVAKQRYDDAESLLNHIAEKNKKHFDRTVYQQFVTEDKKVCIRYFYLLCILSFYILQRVAANKNKYNGFKAIFRSKIMGIIAVNMSYQW